MHEQHLLEKILTAQLVEIRLQLKKEQTTLVEYQKYFLRMVVLVIENFQQLQLHLLQAQLQAYLQQLITLDQ